MSTLDALAARHFPHLSREAGREAVIRLLDTLDNTTLAQARFERHHGAWVTNPPWPQRKEGDHRVPRQEASCPLN